VTCGGDSGNRIFVLYCRCPLIRVSVIKRFHCIYLPIFRRDLFVRLSVHMEQLSSQWTEFDDT
jgi:hypothetical protein